MIPVALLRRKAAFTNAAKLPAVVTLPVMHRIQQFGVYRSGRSFHRRSSPLSSTFQGVKTNLADRPSLKRDRYARFLREK